MTFNEVAIVRRWQSSSRAPSPGRSAARAPVGMGLEHGPPREGVSVRRRLPRPSSVDACRGRDASVPARCAGIHRGLQRELDGFDSRRGDMVRNLSAARHDAEHLAPVRSQLAATASLVKCARSATTTRARQSEAPASLAVPPISPCTTDEPVGGGHTKGTSVQVGGLSPTHAPEVAEASGATG